jgi:hypothetical protein
MISPGGLFGRRFGALIRVCVSTTSSFWRTGSAANTTASIAIIYYQLRRAIAAAMRLVPSIRLGSLTALGCRRPGSEEVREFAFRSRLPPVAGTTVRAKKPRDGADFGGPALDSVRLRPKRIRWLFCFAVRLPRRVQCCARRLRASACLWRGGMGFTPRMSAYESRSIRIIA